MKLLKTSVSAIGGGNHVAAITMALKKLEHPNAASLNPMSDNLTKAEALCIEISVILQKEWGENDTDLTIAFAHWRALWILAVRRVVIQSQAFNIFNAPNFRLGRGQDSSPPQASCNRLHW